MRVFVCGRKRFRRRKSPVARLENSGRHVFSAGVFPSNELRRKRCSRLRHRQTWIRCWKRFCLWRVFWWLVVGRWFFLWWFLLFSRCGVLCRRFLFRWLGEVRSLWMSIVPVFLGLRWIREGRLFPGVFGVWRKFLWVTGWKGFFYSLVCALIAAFVVGLSQIRYPIIAPSKVLNHTVMRYLRLLWTKMYIRLYCDSAKQLSSQSKYSLEPATIGRARISGTS